MLHENSNKLKLLKKFIVIHQFFKKNQINFILNFLI